MKRKLFIFALVFSLAVQLCAPLSAAAPAGYVIDDARGGYIVYTAKGLFEVAGIINSGESDINIFLGADIDIAGKQWTPLGISPEQCYTGTIDGNGHTLSGLTVVQDDYAGLVGYANGVCIKDITLENVYIKAQKNSACIVARAEGDVTVTGCAVSGYVCVDGVAAAGLVGSSAAENILVENCVLAVDIIGKSQLGGVLGSEMRGNSKSMPKYTVKNVIALGSCTESDMDGENYIGSLIGYYNDLELIIDNCVGLTKINATNGAGGLVGTAKSGSAHISNAITLDSVVGTLVPDKRETAHSYENCCIIKDGAADAPAIAQFNIATNGATVKIDGVNVQPSATSLKCINTEAALGKAQQLLLDNARLVAFAEERLGVVLPHDHDFSREAVSPLYLDAEAQCSTKTTYFKSCICGEKGTDTFTAGNKAMHITKGALSSSAQGHWYACDVCGDENAVILPHIYTVWQTDGNKMMRTCRVCNMTEEKDASDTGTTTGGCGSYIANGALTLAAVSLVCTAILKKKK